MGDRMTIRFYFDYISTNAYIAWHALPEMAARHGAVVEPVPVLFAGLLESTGLLGPAEVPLKARWMWRNNLRKAARLGLPLNPPRFHPFNPLLALRVNKAELIVGLPPGKQEEMDATHPGWLSNGQWGVIQFAE
jgi:2-hydroxychromene-2-carboxylate isomerase